MRERSDEEITGNTVKYPFDPVNSVYRQAIHSDDALSKLDKWLQKDKKVSLCEEGKNVFKVYSVLDKKRQVSILELRTEAECRKYISSYNLKLAEIIFNV